MEFTNGLSYYAGFMMLHNLLNYERHRISKLSKYDLKFLASLFPRRSQHSITANVHMAIQKILQRILYNLCDPSIRDNSRIIHLQNDVYIFTVPCMVHFAHLQSANSFNSARTVSSCLAEKANPFSAALEVLISMWKVLVPATWSPRICANFPS
jgi:hypothetical protein